jgi:hypothetical protein
MLRAAGRLAELRGHRGLPTAFWACPVNVRGPVMAGALTTGIGLTVSG